MSLACPSCGREHPEDERFCAKCAVPLVPAGGPYEARLTERQARARKIKPQYSEGDLITVAVSRNLAEAELIQNLLLEEGVPSTLRRSLGFDVPEMLAAGPRNVLVPASGVETAREVLDFDESPRTPFRHPAAIRILACVLIALVLIALVGATLRPIL